MVAVIREVLQQEQAPIDTPDTISEQNEPVENAVQSTHHKLTAQLQLMQKMIQAMQLQYTTTPKPTRKYCGSRGSYGGNNNY